MQQFHEWYRKAIGPRRHE